MYIYILSGADPALFKQGGQSLNDIGYTTDYRAKRSERGGRSPSQFF